MTYHVSYYYAILFVMLAFMVFALTYYVNTQSTSQKNKKLVIVILWLMGTFLIGVAAPSVLTDRLTITDSFVQRTGGFWFLPTDTYFKFDQVERVEVITSYDIKGRKRFLWKVQMKDGSLIQHYAGTLWKTHQDKIIAHLQKHSVDIVYR